MTSTVFVNGVTLSDEDWFNDLNRLHYTIFGDPADLATARRTLLNGMDVVTNSLSGDVSLNNTSNYFAGPSCANATAGKWFASGTVTFTDTAGSAAIFAKLWDGTSLIATAVGRVDTANAISSISLSGYINTPAGNIRISVRDSTSTSGTILYNSTGNSLDSTLTVIRIG